ncbi:MAG: HTTM domain-containing protein [Pseudomonadota bacterium]
MRLANRLREAYLVADLRSLALGRIGFASVLLANLVMRAMVLRDFYSNEGLLPNHTLLWRPEERPVFSLLFAASSPAMAGAAFALCGVAFVALLIGYRTRIAQVASYIAVLSLNARSFINGGDIVLCELGLWSMFLPLGRRWSVDAALDRRRRAPIDQGTDNRVVAPAVAVLIGQLFFVYLLNALHKNGATWRDGSAVHYVLHQDTIVTWFGLWVRGWMTANLSKALTWGTLAVEWTLPVLLASPVALRATRRAALCLAASLHIGFVLFINLEMFTPAMLAYLPFLLRSEDAATFERWWSARWNRLRAWPALARGVRWTSALLDVLAALTPLPDPATAYLPIVARARRAAALARRVTFAALVALAAQRLVATNSRWRGPAWFDQAEAYLMLYERWYMFAPEAPLTDMNVSIDAVTADGRHVDPFNELASPGHPFPGNTIPPHLDQEPLFAEWALRIPFIPDYQQAFLEWVLRYPERTGRPRDHIVSFRAYVVKDDSPPPGQHTPTHTRASQFYEYAE